MAIFSLITLIVLGIIVIVAAIAILTVVNRVKQTIDPIMAVARNVDFDKQDLEAQMTPKSVNAMTSVYLPRIEQDFPEFNYYEFKAKAENMLRSALSAITSEDIKCLSDASTDLTHQINSIISSNIANHLKETYRDVEIHRTEIKNYSKAAGTCVITLQSSVGYYHSVKDKNGNVVKGDDERKWQTRYDIDLMYVQDDTQITEGDRFVGNNCPNCGAPIKMLGAKVCPYCESAVESINIRSWTINKMREC